MIQGEFVAPTVIRILSCGQWGIECGFN